MKNHYNWEREIESSDPEIQARNEDLVKQAFDEAGVAAQNSQFCVSLGNFFAKHLGRGVTLEELAAHMGFSSDYCGRLCKQYTGLNYGTIYLKVRMVYARYLLENTGMTVVIISQLTGYATADYFSLVFKRENGITPTEYRMQLHQKAS